MTKCCGWNPAPCGMWSNEKSSTDEGLQPFHKYYSVVCSSRPHLSMFKRSGPLEQSTCSTWSSSQFLQSAGHLDPLESWSLPMWDSKNHEVFILQKKETFIPKTRVPLEETVMFAVVQELTQKSRQQYCRPTRQERNRDYSSPFTRPFTRP